MRTTITVVAALLLLAGCTSSGSGGGQTTPPSGGSQSTAEPGPASNTSPARVPKIDLNDKWTAMKADIKDGFAATCSASSCTGTDPQSKASVTVSNPGVTPMTQIKVEYDAKADTTSTTATLDLARFALLFSDEKGVQYDFSGFVTDAVDETPIGGSKSKVFAPLVITMQRPVESKWILTIKHS